MASDQGSRDRYSAVVDDMPIHYKCLLGTLPDVVYTLNEKGHFTYISDLAEPSLGFSRQDLVGRHFSTVIHPGDVQSISREYILPRFEGVPTGNERAPKLFDERRSWPRKTANLHVRVCPKPGFSDRENMLLKCKVNASGQYDQHNRFCGTIGVMYDISEENNVSFYLDNKKQYNAFELLTQALSHVFSNVFTGIYGNLQLIEMQLEKPDMFRGNIDAIKQSVENAVTLIRKLSKTVAGQGLCNGSGFRKIIIDTAEEFSRETGMSYCCDEGSGLWHTESDPDYLRHIIRAVYFHIARSAIRDGPITIMTENVHESPIKLPRIDCAYVNVSFAFTPLPEMNGAAASDESSTLERIASMALSYELLKKIGGLILVNRNNHQNIVQLFLPAVRSD